MAILSLAFLVGSVVFSYTGDADLILALLSGAGTAAAGYVLLRLRGF